MEDFTTYTEVDPNNHIGLVGTNHIDFDAYEDEDAYLYKDKGVDHFGSNWEHTIDVKPVSTGNYGLAGFHMVSNDVDDVHGLTVAGKTFLFIYIGGGTNTPRIYLTECYLGTWYEAYYITTQGAWRYLTITKTGTALTCKIYSDSARTTLLTTLSLALHADHKFRYIFAAYTYNAPSAVHNDIDIENLDLQEAAYIPRYSGTVGVLIF
jgi:hypothetical protein